MKYEVKISNCCVCNLASAFLVAEVDVCSCPKSLDKSITGVLVQRTGKVRLLLRGVLNFALLKGREL